jgi:beta-phosphoglucomutase family hydrolase
VTGPARGPAAPEGAARARSIEAVLFDMDGVITRTARTHAAAWKQLFDAFLAARAERNGAPFWPFDRDHDYRRYVDGKARYDGVRSFLASRGITLPEGDPAEPPEAETVCGLGNRKNGYFLERLRRDGAEVYPGSLALVRTLRERGFRVAVISASHNARQVLEAAGVLELFDAKVDGVDARELGLPGKPDPALFLEAARRLGVPPRCAAVVEDALAGVQAGRRGGFALVIGVDRDGHPEELRAAGADLVVGDLAELDLAALETA